MDRTEQNLKVFFIAAALGAFVLALYEAKDEFFAPPEPPAQQQQIEKQDNGSSTPVDVAPLPSVPGF